MTVLSKIAGGLSLVSCLYDTHKTAKIKSNQGYIKASSNAVIENSINNQKIDKMSYKDAERKNWISQHNFGIYFKELGGMIGGYCSGALSSLARYTPNIILSAIAIFSGSKLKNITEATELAKATKTHKAIAGMATIGLAAVELLDFIKNSTSFGQRTDYLK